MFEYVRVKLADKWHFLPKWQKWGGFGFICLVAAVSIPGLQNHLTILSALLFGGLFSIFAGVIFFFLALFKKG